jgi:hypothetical protein
VRAWEFLSWLVDFLTPMLPRILAQRPIRALCARRWILTSRRGALAILDTTEIRGVAQVDLCDPLGMGLRGWLRTPFLARSLARRLPDMPIKWGRRAGMAKVRLFPDVILGKLRKIKRPDYGLNKELRSITRDKDSEPPEHRGAHG